MPRDAPVIRAMRPSSSAPATSSWARAMSSGDDTGDRREALVDSPDQAREHAAGTDFDERARTEVAQCRDGLREAHGCRELLQQDRHEVARTLEAARHRREEGHARLRERGRLEHGAQAIGCERRERAVEGARHLQLDDATRSRRLGGRHERRDAVERAAHHHLAGAVVVGRPHPVDAVAEPLDFGVVETDDGGHGSRGGRSCRCGREAALAREVGRRPVVDRAGGCEGGVLAHRVPHDVVRSEPGRRQPRKTGELRDDEGRLCDIGLAQTLDRPLEAECRKVEPRRLGRVLIDLPRGRNGIAHRTPHTHFLGTLPREAERDLPLPHTTSSQRQRNSVHRNPGRPERASGIDEAK